MAALVSDSLFCLFNQGRLYWSDVKLLSLRRAYKQCLPERPLCRLLTALPALIPPPHSRRMLLPTQWPTTDHSTILANIYNFDLDNFTPNFLLPYISCGYCYKYFDLHICDHQACSQKCTTPSSILDNLAQRLCPTSFLFFLWLET